MRVPGLGDGHDCFNSFDYGPVIPAEGGLGMPGPLKFLLLILSRHTESQRLAPLLRSKLFNRNSRRHAFAQDSTKLRLTDNNRKTGQNQLK